MLDGNRVGWVVLMLLLGACSSRDATPSGSMQGGSGGGSGEAAGAAAGAVPGTGATGAGGAAGAGAAGAGASSCNSAGGSLPMSHGQLLRLEPEPQEPSDCTNPPQNTFEPADECACDGLTCAPEESCRRVTQPARNAVGGPSSDFNGCFELCETDGDCAAPETCVRNLYGLDVCAIVDCRTSADCNEEPCGVCEPGYYGGHGADYEDPSASRCWYPGTCSATSCAGCLGGPDWHLCGVPAP